MLLVSLYKSILFFQSGCTLDPDLHTCFPLCYKTCWRVFFATGKHAAGLFYYYFSIVESLLLVRSCCWGVAERSSAGEGELCPSPVVHLEKHATGARSKLIVACSYLCHANPLRAFVS